MTDQWESDIAAALADAADAIDPAPDGLARIRARIGRHWRWVRPVVVMAATVAVLAGVAGVVAGGRDDPRGRHPAAGVTTPAPGSSAALVYFVGRVTGDDGEESERLFAELRELPAGPGRLAAALSAVMAAPDDSDYRTAWPAGTAVQNARDDNGVVTVDLTAAASLISQDDVVLGILQLQHTVAAVTGRQRIRMQLLVGGTAVTTLGRVPISKLTELSTSDHLDVLASAQVVSPAQGAVVAAGRVTISGEVTGPHVNVMVIHNGQKQPQATPEYRPAPSGALHRYVWELTLDAVPGIYQVMVWSPRTDDTDTKSFTVR